MASEKFKDIAGFVGGLLSGIAAPGMGRAATDIMDRKDRLRSKEVTQTTARRREEQQASQHAERMELSRASDARSQAGADRAESLYQENQGTKAALKVALTQLYPDIAEQLGPEAPVEAFKTAIDAADRERLIGRESKRDELSAFNAETNRGWLEQKSDPNQATTASPEDMLKARISWNTTMTKAMAAVAKAQENLEGVSEESLNFGTLMEQLDQAKQWRDEVRRGKPQAQQNVGSIVASHETAPPYIKAHALLAGEG